MVNVTAAAATISTATAAASTVMQVASLVKSQSRRARWAPRRAGSVGIAGRPLTDIGWPSSTTQRPGTPPKHRGSPRAAVAYSAALARNAAISMMNAADSQTTSVGMIEIMVTHALVHRNETPPCMH
jgi:hypothetical protein